MNDVRRSSTAILLMTAMSLSFAQVDNSAPVPKSSVTIYGALDNSVEWSNSGLGHRYRDVSGGSLGNRLGFRGIEPLGNGLSATFRLEMGLSNDTGALGQSGRVFGREASVGLAHVNYGALRLGHLPAPYYNSERVVDAFGWMGSGGSLATTYGPASAQTQPIMAIVRYDNAIQYDAPLIFGIDTHFMIATGEGAVDIGRTYSASAGYKSGRWDLATGWALQHGAHNLPASGSIYGVFVGGNYNFGPASLYLGFDREKNSCTTCTGLTLRGTGTTVGDFRIFNVGVRAPVPGTAAILLAQIVEVQDRSTYTTFRPGSRNVPRFAVGAEYYFSKLTNLWFTAGTLKNKNGSQYAVGNGTVPQPAGVVGPNNPRATTIALGLRVFF